MDSEDLEDIEDMDDTEYSGVKLEVLGENDYICYICLEGNTEEFQLIYPCKNCKKPVHKECVNQQLHYKDRKCGNCRRKLPVNKDRKFNCCSCVKDFALFLGSIVFFCIKMATLICFGFGKSLMDKNFLHDSVVGLLFICYAPFMLLSQFPPCCHYHFFPSHPANNIVRCCRRAPDDDEDYICGTRENISRSFLTMLMVFPVELLIVLLAHSIGYPTMIIMYDNYFFLTWKTALSGFIVLYSLAIGGVIIWFVLISTVRCIRESYTDEETTIRV